MELTQIKAIQQEVESFSIQTKEQLEDFRLAYLSKKGIIPNLFIHMKDVSVEERKVWGMELNLLKNLAEQKFKDLQNKFTEDKNEIILPDLTLSVIPNSLGTSHPLSMVKNRIVEIFAHIGFNTSEGPEIEDDWHNFTALNFPPDHPAREMQDTFFIEKNKENDIALRTHTSSIQVRVMENEKPPIRTLSLGRVYRNEAISARAHCIFHQVEGLYVNENVSFTDLKQTLYFFVQEMFGKDTQIRFRPSYFPFTEPSAEVDISCNICATKGCSVCKYTGWLEIGGAGMVDPTVLENCKIDANLYTGFAFGMGIERIAMLKYAIKDLRLFTENDVRFLRQFIGML